VATKVIDAVEEYGLPVATGALIITTAGIFAYRVVKDVQTVRAINNKPEDFWDNVITDEEIQGMIDAGNSWLDEKRAAEKAEEGA
jgi:hypothetical protein